MMQTNPHCLILRYAQVTNLRLPTVVDTTLVLEKYSDGTNVYKVASTSRLVCRMVISLLAVEVSSGFIHMQYMLLQEESLHTLMSQ
jgi:hypothetical protein